MLYTIQTDPFISSLLVYIFIMFVDLGITFFITHIGKNMQTIKPKNKTIISLISTFFGFFYITIIYINNTNILFDQFIDQMGITIGISMVINLVLKIYATKSAESQKLVDLKVLEKGKELLEIKNLKIYYPIYGGMIKRVIGNVKAVDDVSFNIISGETIGLVGESGCGKTTIANFILGLVPKEGGSIFYHGKPLTKKYSKYLRQKIQIVFQDPDASLNPRMKVVDLISEPLICLLGVTNKDKLRQKALELLEQVSLKREHLDRYPHEFSGGQKQRIIIARALACNPELIILDEPTSALDVSVQAQILNLLKDLQSTYSYGFLFITHNLAVVNHIADRVVVMYLGKFVEIGNKKQIFSNPAHPYTKALLSSHSEIDPYNDDLGFVLEGEVPSPVNPPSGCYFNPRCTSDARTSACENETPRRIEIEEDHYIWCIKPPKKDN
jgi:oligopeptide/dipeptide ABC transporter ATP-binding protein